MRIGFVVPRYGSEVLGGAETAARLLAEHLATRPGWSAEVFTTCARDSITWADEHAAGTTVEQGVTVHRFRSRSGRAPDFDARSPRYLTAPEQTSPADARTWVELQGPVCPDLLDAAEASDCPLVTFHPYLFWPAVLGVPRLGRRAILHPATHDEPAVRLPVYRDVFGGAAGLVFWTEEERALAQRLFPPVVAKPQLVLGVGVEAAAGEEAAARAATAGLGDRPYLLCVGRVDNGKGTGVLARFFAAYKRRHPGPLALVLAGQVVHPPPSHPDVFVAGAVDEPVKWGLLRGARLLVSPSAYESLSLVVLEAWSVATPVLVNGACDTTRNHCRRAGGGLWFDGYGTFEAALQRLGSDDADGAVDSGCSDGAVGRSELGAAGRAYVAAHYAWPVVLDRYTRFLTRLAAR